MGCGIASIVQHKMNHFQEYAAMSEDYRFENHESRLCLESTHRSCYGVGAVLRGILQCSVSSQAF